MDRIGVHIDVTNLLGGYSSPDSCSCLCWSMSSAAEAHEPLIVLPGPWPGHPQPFKDVRVYDENRIAGCLDCSSCPKSMLCLSGRNLFKDSELQGRPHKRSSTDYYTRYSICADCHALLWFDPWHSESHTDTLHICYWLGKGLWMRRRFEWFSSSSQEALSHIVMAATGKSDPDLVPRFFRKDNLCGHYKRLVGDCARLYLRFLRQRAYLPAEIRVEGWTKHG